MNRPGWINLPGGSQGQSNLLLNLAAAAGGAAARQGLNALGQAASNWWSGGRGRRRRRQPPVNMQPLLQALPPAGAPPNRGRGRSRRRRRGPQSPAMTMGATGSGRIVVSDSECISVTSTLNVVQLNPADDDLPRLKQWGKVYERYRLTSLRLEYVPLSGTATTGAIFITILPGPKRTDVKDEGTIAKCQPLLVRPAWKAGTLRAGANLEAQRFMHCGDTSADGVVATIYIKSTASAIGLVRVHYTVEFAFPHPFA